jgi:hypothetical protein
MGAISITPARLRALITAIEKPAGEDGCWLWRGAFNCDGYPSSGGERFGVPTYRTVYEWMVGEIPDGMELDHLCRVRACVNPHHLEPVTHAENLRRARRVGVWQLRPYCRRGHALVGDNVRWYSTGRGTVERRCIRCHRRDREEIRHAS